MSLYTRTQLKDLFKTGTLSTEDKFAALIDSVFNRSEDSLFAGPLGYLNTSGLIGPVGSTHYGLFVGSDTGGATGKQLNFIHFQNLYSMTSILTSGFFWCPLVGNLTIPTSCLSIGPGAFYTCNGLYGTLNLHGSLVFGQGTYGQFTGCTGFTGDLIIPDGITRLNDVAGTTTGTFYGCSGFNGKLYLSNTMTSIAQYGFYGCTGLNGTLTIPSGVTTIGIQAFYNCTNLSGVLNVPSAVATIGAQAFALVNDFTQYNFYRSTAPTIATNSFGNYAKPLHIPVTNSGYDVAPWTTTAIFSSITNDL